MHALVHSQSPINNVRRLRAHFRQMKTKTTLLFTVTLVAAFSIPLHILAESGYIDTAPPTKLTNNPIPKELRKLGVAHNNDEATIKPLTFVDTQSRVLYYVESDGRHVSAIAADGKLLWHRNPFVDAKLQPYRFRKPIIVWIGLDESRGNSLAISFNSSQFGLLNAKTGEFDYRGRD